MARQQPLIAVVNDEVAFIRLLDALLRDEGYATLLLQAGEIAYESIRQQRPDLVVLDVSNTQPEFSWKTVDLLTIDPATNEIPIIICTVADSIYRDRQAKLQALGHMLVEKPFVLAELVEHMHSLLGRKNEP